MKRDDIKKFFKDWYLGEFANPENSRLLREQEEEEGGDDLFGGDEEDTGEDEEAAEEEDADAEAVDDAEAEAAAEEEKVAIEAGDEVRLGKQFDLALDSLLSDYEMNALKSAQINVVNNAYEEVSAEVDDATNEWYRRGLGNLLFEQEEVVEEEVVSERQIDIDLFGEDVARLIKNYQTLMDMESIIFNKAKEFLMIKYGDEVAEAFAEILRLRHGLDFDSEIEELEDIEVAAPLAVGATGGGGGGAV